MTSLCLLPSKEVWKTSAYFICIPESILWGSMSHLHASNWRAPPAVGWPPCVSVGVSGCRRRVNGHMWPTNCDDKGFSVCLLSVDWNCHYLFFFFLPFLVFLIMKALQCLSAHTQIAHLPPIYLTGCFSRTRGDLIHPESLTWNALGSRDSPDCFGLRLRVCLEGWLSYRPLVRCCRWHERQIRPRLGVECPQCCSAPFPACGWHPNMLIRFGHVNTLLVIFRGIVWLLSWRHSRCLCFHVSSCFMSMTVVPLFWHCSGAQPVAYGEGGSLFYGPFPLAYRNQAIQWGGTSSSVFPADFGSPFSKGRLVKGVARFWEWQWCRTKDAYLLSIWSTSWFTVVGSILLQIAILQGDNIHMTIRVKKNMNSKKFFFHVIEIMLSTCGSASIFAWLHTAWSC